MFTQKTAEQIRLQLGDAWDGRYPITIPRPHFDKMNAAERSAFIKDGGTVKDPEPASLAR